MFQHLRLPKPMVANPAEAVKDPLITFPLAYFNTFISLCWCDFYAYLPDNLDLKLFSYLL